MVYYKTQDEIEFIRESSLLVGKTLAEVAGHIKPGIRTIELDKIAEDFIRSHNAIPAFKGFGGFPASLCISVNQAVVHGIPTDYEIKDTDIISVDCGVLKNGYYGDSAYTFALHNVQGETVRLLRITLESLNIGINFAAPGKRIGDIGYAIQNHAEKNGFSVVRELVGHGVGKDLHEKPEVPNYGRPGNGMIIREGLVIAIEPMINLGKRNIRTLSDQWTIVTSDGKPSAHFEHTVAVTKNGPEILSSFEEIDKVIKKNSNIKSING